MNFKDHFRRFLEADPGRLHFAAHSHHLWPDVTFEAQQRCWLDAARLTDGKWERIFAEIIPALQARIARVLTLSQGETIAFGPNSHSFLLRLLSCLPRRPRGQPLEVLTTDGEVHSFTRQIRRLEEEELVRVTRVPVEPFPSFGERFAEAAGRSTPDFVYFSQVFFDSGFAVADPAALVEAVAAPDTLVALDGYHGFLAVPTDLSGLERRAFYLAGGYKYAMSGEGAAFLHAPPGWGARPRDTGWFAAFGALESGESDAVGYGADGTRFLGATFDPVGLYRMDAVLAWLEALGVSVAAIHARVMALQRVFVERLGALDLAALHPGQLVVPLAETSRGHFLTFRSEAAGAIHRTLLARKVITDHRNDRLRFGFGLYHDEEDILRLCRVLRDTLA